MVNSLLISRAECAGLIEAKTNLESSRQRRRISRAECAGLIEAIASPIRSLQAPCDFPR